MPEYIEREALIQDAEDVLTFPMLDRINRQPAADVETVRHGQWVLQGKNEHDYETSLEEKCSLCGRYVYRYDTQPQDNYCPNCGAKMVLDGKDDNE